MTAISFAIVVRIPLCYSIIEQTIIFYVSTFFKKTDRFYPCHLWLDSILYSYGDNRHLY